MTSCDSWARIILDINNMRNWLWLYGKWGLPWWLSGKESACNEWVAKDAGMILGLGRFPGEKHGNPLQYSCLENPMDRGAWWAIVHGVLKSWTWLSDFTLYGKYMYYICSIYINWKSKSLSRIWLFAIPWTIQSMEFSRPEYWSGYLFPLQGNHPNPWIKPMSPALQADSLPAEPPGKPSIYISLSLF